MSGLQSMHSTLGDDGSAAMVSHSHSIKRKRGRPRKYAADETMGFSHTAAATSTQAISPSPTSLSLKKGRGRPPGSTKKHKSDALGSAGAGFTPHVITVKAGEDVSSKIMSFSQSGPRAVCILAANGAISNVTLRQPAMSGGTVTYEGRYEILSLRGSYMMSEKGGQRSRTGGLTVSLSGGDGRVLGGGVAGLLTAASPVQVVVGSFVAEAEAEELKAAAAAEAPSVTVTAPPKLAPIRAAATSSPSRLSESSGSPFNNTNITAIPWN